MGRIVAILGIFDLVGAILWAMGALSDPFVLSAAPSALPDQLQAEPERCDSIAAPPPRHSDLVVSSNPPVSIGTGWAYLSGAIINHSDVWSATDMNVSVLGGPSATTGRSALPPGGATWWEATVGPSQSTYAPSATWSWVRASCQYVAEH
jgi:hypothetical protein